MFAVSRLVLCAQDLNLEDSINVGFSKGILKGAGGTLVDGWKGASEVIKEGHAHLFLTTNDHGRSCCWVEIKDYSW